MKKVLWDLKEDREACDHDGTPVHIEGDIVWVRDLGCDCNPAAGATCGGCSEMINQYVIGEGQFEWREI
jgi:hypothetical protein